MVITTTVGIMKIIPFSTRLFSTIFNYVFNLISNTAKITQPPFYIPLHWVKCKPGQRSHFSSNEVKETELKVDLLFHGFRLHTNVHEPNHVILPPLFIFHEYIGLSEIVDTSVIICYEIYLIIL